MNTACTSMRYEPRERENYMSERISQRFFSLMLRIAFVFEPLAPRAISYFLTRKLKELKEQGLILDVISNFDSRLTGILEGLGVVRYLDRIFVSSRIGYAKPAREIFQAGLDAQSAGRRLRTRAAIC